MMIRRLFLQRLGQLLAAVAWPGAACVKASKQKEAARLARFTRLSGLLLDGATFDPTLAVQHLQALDAVLSAAVVERALQDVDTFGTDVAAFRARHPTVWEGVLLGWYAGLSPLTDGMAAGHAPAHVYLAARVWSTVRPAAVGLPVGRSWHVPP